MLMMQSQSERYFKVTKGLKGHDTGSLSHRRERRQVQPIWCSYRYPTHSGRTGDNLAAGLCTSSEVCGPSFCGYHEMGKSAIRLFPPFPQPCNRFDGLKSWVNDNRSVQGSLTLAYSSPCPNPDFALLKSIRAYLYF